jgi:hypothetical protein
MHGLLVSFALRHGLVFLLGQDRLVPQAFQKIVRGVGVGRRGENGGHGGEGAGARE